MPLYHLPARGDRYAEGINPDFGDVEVNTWVGVFDEGTHAYVVKTPEPVEGLDDAEIADGVDVGFDYSFLQGLPTADLT